MTRWAKSLPFEQVAHRVCIGGRAIDANTAASVSGVHVVARGAAGTHIARTDARGVFCFEDLPDGTYRITVVNSDRDGRIEEKEESKVESRTDRTDSTPVWVEIRVGTVTAARPKGE